MAIRRIKHSFTAGELSPLMHDRVDFERFRNGCKQLRNAVCATQGPAVRRPGFRFIYDLNSLYLDTTNPLVRMVPFIFNELQAYTMIFYMHTDGFVRMVLGTTDSQGVDGLVIDGSSNIVSLKMVAGWDLEKFDWAQSADEMYIAQPDLQPYIIKRLSHTSWTLTAITFTDQPADWSSGNGWPEKVTFHQQRLVYGANALRRQTIWMSKAGDFHDFGISSPLVASDAVTFTLDSGTQNRIQWMASGKSLHVGTLGNEWTVSGNDQSALTPSNILAQRQTNNGSEPNKALLVGLTTLFVERHGRTVNEFVYDYTFDSYKTSDMAILSSHVTENYSIVDWSYQQTPDSIIWCVRADGALLGITYQRQHKVVGWHVHDTQGLFKAITVIPGNTREDDVWVVVKRTIGDTDHYYIEKMFDWFLGSEASTGQFLDSAKTYYLDTPQSEFTGLAHLAGLTVDVLADGTVHPSVVVTEEGIATLNREYSSVVIGLPYETEIRPHVSDIETREGASLGRIQRITQVVVGLYKSLGMVIGRYDFEDGEYEEEVAFRVPGDLMGKAVPLYTGWYRIGFPEGYDRDCEYFIRQRQPLPLTVRSVVDFVEVLD